MRNFKWKKYIAFKELRISQYVLGGGGKVEMRNEPGKVGDRGQEPEQEETCKTY